MGNIFQLPGTPTSVEQALREAEEMDFEDVIIVGYLKEGGRLATNMSSMSLPEACFLLDQARSLVIEESLK